MRLQRTPFVLLARKEEEVEKVAVEEAEVEEGARDPSPVGLAAGGAQGGRGGRGGRGVRGGPTGGASGMSPAAGDNVTSMENGDDGQDRDWDILQGDGAMAPR